MFGADDIPFRTVRFTIRRPAIEQLGVERSLGQDIGEQYLAVFVVNTQGQIISSTMVEIGIYEMKRLERQGVREAEPTGLLSDIIIKHFEAERALLDARMSILYSSSDKQARRERLRFNNGAGDLADDGNTPTRPGLFLVN